MKQYNITLKFQLTYEDLPFNEKTAEELATDICHLVCDEVAIAGGVGLYHIEKAEKRDT